MQVFFICSWSDGGSPGGNELHTRSLCFSEKESGLFQPLSKYDTTDEMGCEIRSTEARCVPRLQRCKGKAALPVIKATALLIA